MLHRLQLPALAVGFIINGISPFLKVVFTATYRYSGVIQTGPEGSGITEDSVGGFCMTERDSMFHDVKVAASQGQTLTRSSVVQWFA